MNTVTWFGDPVTITGYTTDPDAGLVALVRLTPDGAVLYAPAYDLRVEAP